MRAERIASLSQLKTGMRIRLNSNTSAAAAQPDPFQCNTMCGLRAACLSRAEPSRVRFLASVSARIALELPVLSCTVRYGTDVYSMLGFEGNPHADQIEHSGEIRRSSSSEETRVNKMKGIERRKEERRGKGEEIRFCTSILGTL